MERRLRCGLVPRGCSHSPGVKLGAPVVPFYPFSFGVPLLKPNSKKKGALIIKGLLGNLEKGSYSGAWIPRDAAAPASFFATSLVFEGSWP